MHVAVVLLADTQLSVAPEHLREDFKTWMADPPVMLLNERTVKELENRASFVLLCDDLDKDSADFRALRNAVDAAELAYRHKLEERQDERRKREEAAAAAKMRAGTATAPAAEPGPAESKPTAPNEWWPGEGTLPKLQFFVVPGPRNDLTNWVRKKVATGGATLAPAVLDLRAGQAERASYAMRGVGEVMNWPTISVSSLCAEGGKRLALFVELYCSELSNCQPSSKYFDASVRTIIQS